MARKRGQAHRRFARRGLLLALIGALLLALGGATAGEPSLAAARLLPGLDLEEGHWQVLGPFEWVKEPRKFWGDKPLPPDGRFDLEATYQGLGGPVRWTEAPEWDEDGRIHEVAAKAGMEGKDGCLAAYLYRRVDSPADLDAILYLGFDDGLVLRLNGDEIFQRFFYRSTEPREEAIPIRLRAGRNDFLLKLAEKDNTSACGLSFEIRPAVPPALERKALEASIAAPSLEKAVALRARWRLAHVLRQLGDLGMADSLVREVAADPGASSDQKALAGSYFATRPAGLGAVLKHTTEGGRVSFTTERGTLHVTGWREAALRLTFVPKDAPWPYGSSRRPLPVPFDLRSEGAAGTVADSGDRFTVRHGGLSLEILKGGSAVVVERGASRRMLELGTRREVRQTSGSGQKVLEGPFEEIAFHLTAREGVFGMGSRYDGFNRRGRRNAIGNCDRAFGESHFTLPHFITQGQDALFINSFGDGEISVDRPEAENVAFCRIEEPVLDLFYFTGPPKSLVRQYVDLTGHTVMPPDWTLGVWMSRNSYENREVVLEVAKKLREHKVPAHVLVLEAWREDGPDWMTWNPEKWKDHEGMLKSLHEMGFRVVVWTMQYHIFNRAHPRPYEEEAFDKRYFVMEGEKPWGWDGGSEKNSYIVDFFNPAAREWWERQYRPLFHPLTGIDGLKTDIGENNGGVTFQGWKNINNIYALEYIRCAWNMTKKVSGEGMVFARTGTVGTQRYPILWAGDHSTWFQGMQEALSAMLSGGVSGYAWTTFDVGGLYGDLDKETYVRMAEMGAFCPILQAHGQGRREPYDFGDFGEEAVEIFNRYAGWYMDLKAYRIAAGREACETGLPILRPLWMEYPDDPACYDAEHQYFFGPDILVAPIVSYDHARWVYLPNGKWVDWWTGTIQEGARRIRVEMSLDRMPIHVRPGSDALKVSPGFARPPAGR